METLDTSEVQKEEDALHTRTHKPVVFPVIQKPVITPEIHDKSRLYFNK